jgi:hypothetical protein
MNIRNEIASLDCIQEILIIPYNAHLSSRAAVMEDRYKVLLNLKSRLALGVRNHGQMRDFHVYTRWMENVTE